MSASMIRALNSTIRAVQPLMNQVRALSNRSYAFASPMLSLPFRSGEGDAG